MEDVQALIDFWVLITQASSLLDYILIYHWRQYTCIIPNWHAPVAQSVRNSLPFHVAITSLWLGVTFVVNTSFRAWFAGRLDTLKHAFKLWICETFHISYQTCSPDKHMLYLNFIYLDIAHNGMTKWFVVDKTLPKWLISKSHDIVQHY